MSRAPNLRFLGTVVLLLFTVQILPEQSGANTPLCKSPGFFNDGPGWLGIRISRVPYDLRKELKLGRREGALVTEVEPSSPAEEAGIEEDDIIITFDGKKVKGPEHLSRLVRKTEVGKTVKIEILRDGELQQLEAEIEERPEDFPFSFMFPHHPPYYWRRYSRAWLGVELQKLNKDLAKYFGVSEKDGVLITEVQKDSPAEKAGLKAGDVIAKIDGEQVREPRDVREIIAEEKPGRKIDIEILRNGQREIYTIKLGKHPSRRFYFGKGGVEILPWDGGFWLQFRNCEPYHKLRLYQHRLQNDIRERIRAQMQRLRDKIESLRFYLLDRLPSI